MRTYRVPNLQLNHLVVDLEAEAAEFDADRHLMLIVELVVHDSLHEARLADARVANDDQLEEMVLRGQRLVADDLIGHRHKVVDLVLLHCVTI